MLATAQAKTSRWGVPSVETGRSGSLGEALWASIDVQSKFGWGKVSISVSLVCFRLYSINIIFKDLIDDCIVCTSLCTFVCLAL